MRVFTYPVTDGYTGREGWAVEFEPGRFRDTHPGTDGAEGIELTAKEIAGLHFQFETEEFDELTGKEDGTVPAIWSSYSSANRHLIPSQHGKYRRWFIRKATDPEIDMDIFRERWEIRDAEETIQLARGLEDKALEILAAMIQLAEDRRQSAQIRLTELENSLISRA